jgi:hypothetical protein
MIKCESTVARAIGRFAQCVATKESTPARFFQSLRVTVFVRDGWWEIPDKIRDLPKNAPTLNGLLLVPGRERMSKCGGQVPKL